MMASKEILTVLREHGFWSGRLISHSKSGYRKRYPKHFVVFNSKVFTRRCLVLRTADLDLTLDAERLIAAARAIGENLYVLQEHNPNPFWQPGTTPATQLLSYAVWWTRIHPEDQDQFVPVGSARRRRNARLTCATGTWQGQAAYLVDSWNNPGCSFSGAAVQLCGRPPERLRKVRKWDTFGDEPSKTRGRPTRPLFYQRTGPLEYVWFAHGTAMPTLLYDQNIRPLNAVSFTSHRDSTAIHVRQAGKVVGLIWPCAVAARGVAANAREHLRALLKPRSRVKPWRLK